ncbi:unnamed protein product [Rangifer tarandus platyrhynchus]|uniref:Uncharacterized protein n=1 Tax=Rangifer tarandus platyrhynchus TaxID=3082113 RepID=A0ACB1MIV3_RANTA
MDLTHIPEDLSSCPKFGNKSCPPTNRHFHIRVIMYSIMIGAMFITIFGNLVIIISISHFKQLHSPTNFLILSMATTDFLLGLVVMPYSMVRSVESCWYFGDGFCKFHTSFDMMLSLASIFHLCSIAIDRFYAVCYPLHYTTTMTISMIKWLLAFCWSAPALLSFGLVLSKANVSVSALTCVGDCQIAVNQSWVLVDFLLFFIPTLVMIVLYSKIFLIAKHQARQIESLSNKIGRCSDSYQDRVARRERKAARTLGVAVLAFLISWLPYFLDVITDAFLGFITPTCVYEILVWVAYYNSAMNPLIDAFFYPWFRKAIKLIVTGKVLRENSSTVNLFSG